MSVASIPSLGPVVRYRKPPQLADLGTRHAVVEASAGTGKTYILEHLVVDLILSRGATIDQVLVVTFTEKATSELSTRIRRKLEELKTLTVDHPNVHGDGGDDAAGFWVIDDGARARLTDALLGFDRAAISTIHGFCQRLLTEHAFLNRRLFREEAVAEEEAFGVAFADSLRREPARDGGFAALLSLWLGAGNSLAKLRKGVLQAVRGLSCLYPARADALRPAPPEPSAIVAAAQAFAGLPTGEVLRGMLKQAKVHASTTKALVEKWSNLHELAGACARPEDVPVFLAAVDVFHRNRNDALTYLHERLDPRAVDPAMRALAVGFRALEAVAHSPLAALVAHLTPVVQTRLSETKRQAGRFDFQDMLTLVAEGLQGQGGADDERSQTLLATLRGRYRYALIDEFQDTDEVQWNIFRKIFFDSRDGHVLTVIGDPKQAIYAFRGADVFTYLSARAAIEAVDGARVFLTDNFRSTPPVIDAYNAILDQRAPFFREAGGILYDHPVTCGRPGLGLTDAQGGPAKGVVVLDVESSNPGLLTWQVKRAILTRMAEEVRDLLSPGRALRFGPADARTAVRAGDIFVLTRTTRESREVGDALRAVNVPFAFFKQERLFETVEARDLLDLLRAIADPDDATARARAFITPFFGLGLADLAACDDLDAGDDLLRSLTDWAAMADAGDFETLFARIVAQSGVICRELFFRDGERSLTNTLHLIEILQEEAARARTTIRELCETLGAFIAGTRRPPGLSGDIQRLETDADAVQIMTIHHAKGLEAPVVFLYGGFWTGPTNDVRVRHDEDGHRICDVARPLPEAAAAYVAEQEDEERRVLYVALTRAKARLYLPRYPANWRQLKGAYRFVNARLHDLLGGFADESVQALFARVSIPCPGPGLPPPLPATQAAVAAWTPPAGLLAPPSDGRAFAEQARARRGFFTTSYTAIKRGKGAGFVSPAPAYALGDGLPDDLVDGQLDDGDLEAGFAAQIESAAPSAWSGASGASVGSDLAELSRGRISGRFLHAVLEEVPLETLARAPALADWIALPVIAALFDRMQRRYDRSAADVPIAQRLVHTALTVPVPLGDVTVPALSRVQRTLRELEFLYPIPEVGHRLLGLSDLADHDGRKFSIGRGLIKGYIDLLFEHEGRVYLCDWKGDWLPGWTRGEVDAHVAANYTLQAQLYTIGVLRFLGVRTEADFQQRFGGVVYAFLRGMSADDPGRGIYFESPRFDDVLAWQDQLLRRDAISGPGMLPGSPT